jgi:energy-coupling factor transporter transmembrane protein EcfT
MKGKVEYIHSWYLLLISLFSLFFLLLSSYLLLNALLVIIIHYFCFKNGMTAKILFRHIIYSLLFASMMFGMNYLWRSVKSDINVNESLLLSGKLFLLVLASMASARFINYTKVIMYLIIHQGLKVLWGYPLMIALNSIVLFKDEYEKIKLSGRLRNLSAKDKIGLLFPLLVFAIRHSQRGSLSLVTRGLHPSKSFYFSYETTRHDRKLFLSFIVVYAFLVIGTLAYYFNFR